MRSNNGFKGVTLFFMTTMCLDPVSELPQALAASESTTFRLEMQKLSGELWSFELSKKYNV